MMTYSNRIASRKKTQSSSNITEKIIWFNSTCLCQYCQSYSFTFFFFYWMIDMQFLVMSIGFDYFHFSNEINIMKYLQWKDKNIINSSIQLTCWLNIKRNKKPENLMNDDDWIVFLFKEEIFLIDWFSFYFQLDEWKKISNQKWNSIN